ncbi:MAG: calcium/sodium antiporter [Thermodesulfobacteriota bacterium]|nr:calcium/sodium antiporter [Thermodesulfobacteriota bacterium]
MEIFRWLWDANVLHNLMVSTPTLLLLLIIVICIAILSKGADWMIDGAVALAERTGLSKIVIGATIISLGTTMPEAFVSVMAAWMGNPGLALGNGVGSIIADTGLIFGLACILAPIPTNRFVLSRTGWVQVGVATLLVIISIQAFVSMHGHPVLNRWVGILFLILLAGYMYMTYRWSRQDASSDGESHNDAKITNTGCDWLMVVGGLVMVVAGARMLVPAAAEIALRIGVPEDVIAATMVAFGTSLPELMTAFVSIRKGHPDIIVGNIVGADVLNCLFVIGAAAAVKPLSIPPNFFIFHFPAMLIILYSFRTFIFMNRDGGFRKWQGVWLLSVYLAYVILQYTIVQVV